MKTKYLHRATLYLALGIALTTGLGSCSFDDAPEDKLTDETIWHSDNLLDEYTMAWYHNMNHGWASLISTSSFFGMKYMSYFPNCIYTDQITYGRSNWVNSGVGEEISSRISTITLYARNRWSGYYTQIQSINRLLGHESELPSTYRDRILGEAHFMRGYYYLMLLMRYGGPLLIDHNYDPLTSDERFPRASFKEAVDFIVNEANQAAELLPVEQDDRNTGRATRGAAIMLKAKAYFWAGSPQFQNKTKEVYGFTDNQTNNYMRQAIEAYQELDALQEYQLVPVSGTTQTQIANSYHDLFLQHNNKESIFEYQHGTSKLTDEGAHSLDEDALPPSLTGTSCAYCPTQNHVDEYGMRDGYTYDAQHPYVGRDYRFYANVLYDGVTFRDSVMRLHYTVKAPGDTVAGSGLQRYGTGRNNGYTRTGYYMRKFMDPSIRLPYDDNSGSNQDYPIWRYAEALLDWAEAAYRTGDEATALQKVNLVRERVHMQPLTSVTLDKILNERRVELAFEESIYWDEIRLGTAAQDLDGEKNPMRLVKIVEDQDGNTSYSYAPLADQAGERAFRDYQYYYPIPWDEVRFQNIEQNEGWVEQ